MLELRGGAVGERLRREPLLLGRALHLLPVLIHPGDEKHVETVQPLPAREGVGRDALIGVADVRRSIGVGNGGRDHISGARHGAGLSRFGGAGKRREGVVDRQSGSPAARAVAKRTRPTEFISGPLRFSRLALTGAACCTTLSSRYQRGAREAMRQKNLFTCQRKCSNAAPTNFPALPPGDGRASALPHAGPRRGSSFGQSPAGPAAAGLHLDRLLSGASCIILRASDFAAGTRDVGFVGAQAGAARKAETRKI